MCHITEKRSQNSRKDGLIMVIDDEEMILKIICIIISKMGYKPVAFSHSLKALDYYRDHFSDIDLVLLDMIMPEMNGKILFESMKKINPKIKALLLSGWIEEKENREIEEWGLIDFLHKPLEKENLEKSIKNALSL